MEPTRAEILTAVGERLPPRAVSGAIRVRDAVVAHVQLDGDVRSAILVAALCGGIAVAALTEVLSAFRGLTRGWLLVSWIVVLAAAAFVAAGVWARRRTRPQSTLRTPGWSLDLAMLAWIAGSRCSRRPPSRSSPCRSPSTR